MKIFIIVATWSATLSLALPAIAPKASANTSIQKNKEADDLDLSDLPDLLKISGVFVTGGALAGAGFWIHHRSTVKELRDEHKKATEQLVDEWEQRKESYGKYRARVARDEAYARGKADAKPTEEKHERLLKCFKRTVRGCCLFLVQLTCSDDQQD